MATAVAGPSDERLTETSALRRVLSRPELGAFAGTLLVFLFFGAVAGTSGMFSPRASSPSLRSRHSWASLPSSPRC